METGELEAILLFPLLVVKVNELVAFYRRRACPSKLFPRQVGKFLGCREISTGVPRS